MHLEETTLRLLRDSLQQLDSGFAALPGVTENSAEPPDPRLAAVMTEVATRLQDNYPYFHPLYAGQMLKPPHSIARAAYALATWINPNNHALDGGRASSAMEKEAVAADRRDVRLAGTPGAFVRRRDDGQPRSPVGCRPACIRGRKSSRPISRITRTNAFPLCLQLPFAHVPTDDRGRMDTSALEKMLAAGDVGCVVATAGTTGTGSVDPLPEILRLRERYGFRLHVDAAYGGYFTLASNLAAETRASFELIGRADSIVIDPHKHGLQPYGCGCVLFRDPQVGAIYKHESPYTYFTSSELHLGEISLECSRPGASAVALWATQRLLPLVRRGEFAVMLEASRDAALQFARRLANDARWLLPFAPELDIVVWAPRAKTVAEISALSQRIFDAAAKQNLHLALIRVPVSVFGAPHDLIAAATDTVLCLRSVLMKPEHRDWLDRIWNILSEVADGVLAQ